jgi:hypothetical protein
MLLIVMTLLAVCRTNCHAVEEDDDDDVDGSRLTRVFLNRILGTAWWACSLLGRRLLSSCLMAAVREGFILSLGPGVGMFIDGDC